ncbi:hypothetical protein M569_16617 [Genlisea aurea]|uniref:Uncharacterized protein n=1 Tax=Genlisea aurea TaxID=192259 RepID=S8BUB6_9LAMI|nr:hypothetical protein M569_16617 [Genlisea aurea]
MCGIETRSCFKDFHEIRFYSESCKLVDVDWFTVGDMESDAFCISFNKRIFSLRVSSIELGTLKRELDSPVDEKMEFDLPYAWRCTDCSSPLDADPYDGHFGHCSSLGEIALAPELEAAEHLLVYSTCRAEEASFAFDLSTGCSVRIAVVDSRLAVDSFVDNIAPERFFYAVNTRLSRIF